MSGLVFQELEFNRVCHAPVRQKSGVENLVE